MRTLAAFCLPIVLFQFSRILTTSSTNVPIYAVSALFFIVAYGFSRSRHTTVAGLYAALAASLIPYGGVGTQLASTSVYEEVMWMVLAVFIASLALPIYAFIAWGAANVAFLALLFAYNPSIPTEAALTVIAFVLLVSCLSGIWSSIKASDERTIDNHTEQITRTAEHLRREMDFANKTIAAMGDALLVADHKRNIVLVNRSLSELLGFDPTRLVGLPAAMLFSRPETIQEVFNGMETEQACDGDLIEARAVELMSSTGAAIPMTLNVAAIRSNDDRLLGAVCVARDMRPTARLAEIERQETEQRKRSMDLEDANMRLVRMQAQLIHAGKLAAVGKLAAAFGHEISRPLDRIDRSTTSILESRRDDEDLKSRLADIVSSQAQAARIVKRLLTFGRETGLVQEPVDLAEVVRSSVDLVGHKVELGGATVSTSPTEGEFIVLGDRSQLLQVVINLLLNAGQAVAEGGHVSVNLEVVEGLVQLTVTDDGVGMSPEEQERIFEPFFTTREMGEGTGLGLSTSYGVIRGHGGTIDVESRKGQGSSFKVHIPWRPERVKPVVLIVDDSSLVLPALVAAVTRAGSVAYSASCTKDAMGILANHGVDIVLSDMNLGREDGIAFLEDVHSAYPKTMKLLISGSTLPDLPEYIFDFLPKPVSLHELKYAIASAMTERRVLTCHPLAVARV